MTPELIGIITVGVALAGTILISNRDLRGEMRDHRNETRAELKEIRADLADVRDRVARIEGLFEGMGRRKAEPSPTTES